jgi:hypothetical protein
MTDEKIIEVVAHAIDPDVMEATTNGAFADVNEDVERRQCETRERADEVLRSLRFAGYEIVPAGELREARADALAEAAEKLLAQNIEDFGDGTEDGETPDDGAVGGGLDGNMATTFFAIRGLADALSAYRSGGSGWRSIESAPRDGSPVDLWLEIYASPRSMGFSDSFRVVDAHWSGTAWVHMHKGKLEDLYEPYVRFWRPIPTAPETEGRDDDQG